MSVLDPISHALAAVVATTHDAVTAVGAPPDSGATWVVCIAAVVLSVRLLVLPIAVHGVRLAHANARARPQLAALSKKYRGRTDPDTMRKLIQERRAITAEHGVSRWGCLPMLVQIPVWIALYHLLSNLSRGQQVGLMDADQVASLRDATLAGVPLADSGYLGAGGSHLAVVAGLAASAALLSFVTQHWLVRQNLVVQSDAPEAMLTAQRMMPVISAGAMLVAGGVVPVALLVYWVCSQLWTMGQSAVVWRFFPTPGSAAAERFAAPATT